MGRIESIGSTEKKFESIVLEGISQGGFIYFSPMSNFSANDNYAFLEACWNGHIEVSQWLLSLSNPLLGEIDISITHIGKLAIIFEIYQYICN